MPQVYYKINLNKASNRLDQFAVKQQRKRMMAIGFYLLVIVAITVLAVTKTTQGHSKIKTLRAELAQIQGEIDQLQASSEYLSPDDIFTLAQAANTRLTWTEKLDVLGRILPRDVAITGLEYDFNINMLMIKGITKVNPNLEDLDLVMSIVDIIKKDANFTKGFNDIKFSGSNRIKHQGQEVITFEIACMVG
jgi:Tfp pilus assembly protein PilN